MKRTALVLFLVGVVGVADAATTIYRCGPGGRELSQKPCLDGTVVEGTDGRTAAQRAAAVRMVEQEKRKASELERARRAEEAKNKVTPAVKIDGLARPADDAASAVDTGRPQKKTAKSKTNDKGAKDFVAIEPIVKKK